MLFRSMVVAGASKAWTYIDLRLIAHLSPSFFLTASTPSTAPHNAARKTVATHVATIHHKLSIASS